MCFSEILRATGFLQHDEALRDALSVWCVVLENAAHAVVLPAVGKMPPAVKVIVRGFIKQICLGLSGFLPFTCSCQLTSCHKQVYQWSRDLQSTALLSHPRQSWVVRGSKLFMKLRTRALGRPVPAHGWGQPGRAPRPPLQALQRTGTGPWVHVSLWYLRHFAHGSGHVLPADLG